MSQPFLGQVQPFAFGYAPKGWAQCNGQTMSIGQNTSLFAVLGTTYGGDGNTTFMLPNLQSCVPIGQQSGVFDLGATGGVETVQLVTLNLPIHSHGFSGTTGKANQDGPNAAGAVPATIVNIRGGGQAPDPRYAAASNIAPLNFGSIGNTGGNQAHANIQPYLAINWCIALLGVFPTRN